MEQIADTQTQPQTQSQWMVLESQPIENIIWGRLYSKNIKLKSLGITKIIKIVIENSKTFDLCNDKFVGGRSEACDLVFTEEELSEKILCRISKLHFKIERDIVDLTNPVLIYDLGRNGTYVNGKKVGYNNKQILLNDDVISLVHPQYKVFVFKDMAPNDLSGLHKEIYTKYYVSRRLGAGACGIVRSVYDKITCAQYAMKQVQKNRLTENARPRTITDTERIMNEVRIMKSLDHPCVIKMHDIVDNPESVYMILELMKGGDLLSRILKHKRLSENISKLYFYQMCLAVKYLHEKGITHRDLKPDNVLLATDNEDTLLKVSDFGLSKFVGKNSVMQTLCGTPLYVAPEILKTSGRGSYTKKVDIWSLGVVLYTCLSGTLPFSDDYGSHASEQIKRGQFKFRHPSWKNVSITAKQLIIDILTVDPMKRPNIIQILAHPWLCDEVMIFKANELMGISADNNISSIRENVENIPQRVDPTQKQRIDELFMQPPAKRARHT